MGEWWSYGLSDLLLFSTATYYRLIARYNMAVWPAQFLTQTAGLVILAMLFRRPPWQGRAITAILCAAWIWVAWAYHLQRYATVNWVAPWFAAAFMAQAAIMLWSGVIRGRLAFKPSGAASITGLGLFIFALVVQPLVAPLAGRTWLQTELFAIMPDPTAVATLGLLLMVRGSGSWMLMLIPMLWCLISGAVLWGMHAPEAIMTPLAAFIVLVFAAGNSGNRKSIPQDP